MSWKDWLYIPKSDKVAIMSLFVIILIMLVILFFVKTNRKQTLTEPNLTMPENYKAWQAKLMEQKEEEKEIFVRQQKTLYPTYQAKIGEGETIELNTADTTSLKSIPGIGSGFANRIVRYRNALGGFANIEQLNEVWGLDMYLYSQIMPYLTLETKHDSLYINKDSLEKLFKHPYLNKKQVLVIEDLRTRKGDIKSFKRLHLLDEFTLRDIEKLSLYISFQ